MNDQFNGNTEKRHSPPHLTGHEVYEMVKDVHVGDACASIKDTHPF
jgi:hypothetical protein